MPLVVLEGIQGGTRIDLLFFLFFFTKKYIFTAIVFTYRGQILAFLCTSQLLFQKWSLKCLAAILFMGICAKSGFPNF